MIDPIYEPTKAEQLAAIVKGNASTDYRGATVQRSHRFPTHLFFQIENMAEMGNIPVSQVINELIEVGLEAVRANLHDEEIKRLHAVSQEQIDRLMPSAGKSAKR